MGKRKYTLNETVFNTISEESTYWLGFLMADGCITTRKKTTFYLNLSLKKDDIEHIRLFTKFLGSNQPIITRQNNGFGRNGSGISTISISSQILVDSVVKFGIVPKKSHIATAPQILEYDRNFWRGVVDGDGRIYITQNHLPAIGLVGNKHIIEQFEKFVKSLTNCKSHSYKKKNTNSWQFQAFGVSST